VHINGYLRRAGRHGCRVLVELDRRGSGVGDLSRARVEWLRVSGLCEGGRILHGRWREPFGSHVSRGSVDVLVDGGVPFLRESVFRGPVREFDEVPAR
jgi:hypothetical protein